MNLEHHKIKVLCFKLPFKSEVDNLIKEYCSEHQLIFEGNDYKTFWEHNPTGIDYHISFLARKKTSDDLLGEQLEYFISNL